MTVTKYQIAFCLTAAFFLPIAFATSSTTEATTDTSTTATTESTTESTTASATTTEAITTTQSPITCHQHTCEWDGCIQNATDSNTTGSCTVTGYCFARLTSNSTYTKEELGCESNTSGCGTTIHDDGDAKRICCTTANCNSITTLKQGSSAPGLSFSLALLFSSVLLCVGTF